MKTTNILIGVAILGAGYYLWKMYQKNKNYETITEGSFEISVKKPETE